MARFLHLADIHLGTSQYHSAERNSDFFKAFWGAIERYALSGEGVDFVLIAGDLFDKRQIDARTLSQATVVLKRLADRQIPVCIVEGNHDRAYYGEGSSWLEYLNALELVRLLRNDIGDDGQVILNPWQPGQKPGAYTDIGDIRVIGTRYYGASTAKAIAPLAEAIQQLPQAPFTVLVWHMGLEGHISALAGGVTVTQLAPLRGCTDYLALGHVHERYDVDEWLYNPGSLEATNIAEANLPHGANVVTVDHNGHRVEPVEDYPRRPFVRLSFDLTPFDSPDQFQEALPGYLQAVAKADHPLAPVIELSLTGTCRFSRSALDLEWIRQLVTTTCTPLLVLVRNVSSSTTMAIAPDADAAMDRRELETYILQDCFARDSRFRPASARCSHLLLDLKHRLENGEKPGSLFTYLKEAVPDALRGADADTASPAAVPAADAGPASTSALPAPERLPTAPDASPALTDALTAVPAAASPGVEQPAGDAAGDDIPAWDDEVPDWDLSPNEPEMAAPVAATQTAVATVAAPRADSLAEAGPEPEGAAAGRHEAALMSAALTEPEEDTHELPEEPLTPATLPAPEAVADSAAGTSDSPDDKQLSLF